MKHPHKNERTEVQNPHRPYPYRQRRKQELASYSTPFFFSVKYSLGKTHLPPAQRDP